MSGFATCCIRKISLWILFVGVIVTAPIQTVMAAEWSSTDVQLLYGNNYKLGSNAPGDTSITTVTLQHASGWEYGDNYFFFDLTAETNGAERADIYGEYYPRLSFGKITGTDMSVGILKDVLLSGGINYGTDLIVALYGISFDLNIPAFDWFRFDVQAFDTVKGTTGREKLTYQLTPSWSAPINIGPAKFEFSGFIDIIGPTGGGSKIQFLTQPQLRLDVGNFFDKPGKFYAGIEYQYWHNKFGVDGVDDHVPQLLMMYKF